MNASKLVLHGKTVNVDIGNELISFSSSMQELTIVMIFPEEHFITWKKKHQNVVVVVSAKDVSNYPSLHASLHYSTLQYKSSMR